MKHSSWFSNLRQRKLACAGFFLLALLYFLMIFADFIAPYAPDRMDAKRSFLPPNLSWHSEKLGFGPQVQGQGLVDKVSFRYVRVKGQHSRVVLLPKVNEYKLWGIIPLTVKLFGSSSAEPVYLMGADGMGRDIFSRLLFGSRISLTVGFFASFFALFIAITLGGLAGYRGGLFDAGMMRFSEFIILIPGLYLILFLRSIISRDLDPGQSYALITVVLSLVGWPGTARMIRGMVHAYKNEEFVEEARLSGVPARIILWRHILPQMSSLLIVSFALSIPGFILGETVLSYLGLGITDPAVSWGSMISRDFTTLANLLSFPWLIWPGVVLILVSISFTFLGEWMRDYLDPFHAIGRRDA